MQDYFVLTVRKNTSLNNYSINFGDIEIHSPIQKEADENKYMTSQSADSAAQYFLHGRMVRKLLLGRYSVVLIISFLWI